MSNLNQIFSEIKPYILVEFNKSEVPRHQTKQAISLIKNVLLNQLNKDLKADKLDNIILLFTGNEYDSRAYLHLIYAYTHELTDTLGMDMEKASAWSHHIIPYTITLIGDHLSYSDFTKSGVMNLINSSEDRANGKIKSFAVFIKSLLK